MIVSQWRKSQEDLKKLRFDRFWLVFGFIGSLVTSYILVDVAIRKERLEIVYLDGAPVDGPVKLPKVRSDEASHKAGSMVRSFVGTFISSMFPDPDSLEIETAKPKLAWLHAHSGSKGSDYAEKLNSDVKGFVGLYKGQHRIFSAETDSAMTIKQVEEDQDLIIAKIPGSLHIKTDEGESTTDKVFLQILIRKHIIDGMPTALGDFNRYGLTVEDGAFLVPTEQGYRPLALFND